MGIQRSKKTKIYPDNVALGRDTTGNYVASASASTGINISGSPSENSQLTISNTGVTSLTGTANEVELSASAGAVQVGLPNEVRIESLSSGTASVDVSSQENIFVSIRSNSTVAQTSTDGIAWTLRTIMPSSQGWQSVTYGNNTFVAVANNSAAAASSTDGIAWTARTLPSSQGWQSVTYGNNTFVTVASGSAAASSTDGIAWTASTLPSSQSWRSVTYGNNTFVAVANNSAAAASSTDGIAWTARTLPSSQSWQPVTYGNNTFVAIAYYSAAAATSTDGTTWTASTMPSSPYWFSVTYGNNTFVAVAFSSAAAASSTDGITWTARTMPSSQFWSSVTYGNNTFVAIALGSAASSTDGITWTARTNAVTGSKYALAYGTPTVLTPTPLTPLPTQTGNSGKYLTTDGTNSFWSEVSGSSSGVTSLSGTLNEIEVSASVGNITLSLPSTINANTTGSAATLTTPRSIGLSGDVSGSANFDGSSNITITATVADDSHNHIISNVDGLQTALDAKASLDSPALTGTPTAPTATVDTNTTQIATTAYVVGQAGSATPIVNGTAAVGTSLRYARQDHVHGTDTTRAPLASPTFTGTVTVPTLSLTTTDTATTATHYMVETATDGIVRPKTLANVRTEIVTNDAVNAAAATTVGTITSGTWAATDIGLAHGGTNASLTAANGAVVYSTSSALALTSVGTTGQVLTSNGAGAPTWQEPSGGGEFSAFLLAGM